MIFRRLRGKSSGPTQGELMARMFDLSLPDLLQMLADKISREEPAARTMVLVALANARSDLRANKSLNKSYGTEFPTTYAELGQTVALLFDKYPPTPQNDLDIPTEAEIKFRRLYHFYNAAVVGAVSERAHATNIQLTELASIWRSYIDSARHLDALLSHTLIWSDDEIAWFGGCVDEESQIRTCFTQSCRSFFGSTTKCLAWPSNTSGFGRVSLKAPMRNGASTLEREQVGF
jgi:hypothetical protein